MDIRSRLAAITLSIALATSTALCGSAFAQSGSTGGTLGKTDKSASGGRNEGAPVAHHPTPRKTVRREKPPAKSSRPIGCFRDTNAPLDLDGYIERSQANTPGRCVAICKSKGFRYAGVQYGESCLCGNSYGRYGPASNCVMACTGDPSETCGGGFANYVYATGAP